MVRGALRNIVSSLPDKPRAVIEYWFRPSLARGFGPLNDQVIRQDIFNRIFADIRVSQIIETGTYRGTTTEFFAQTDLPVHSIEVSERYYWYSKLRLRSFKNVHLYKGSSTYWLPKICARLQSNQFATLVYLDAHWRDYLPLREEIEILSDMLPNSVIMIDDFEVPGDLGYGFDDYGPGMRLSVEYLDTAKAASPLFVFFPSQPSTDETGGRRGTCVVSFTGEISDRLKSMDLLKFHSVRDPFKRSSF